MTQLTGLGRATLRGATPAVLDKVKAGAIRLTPARSEALGCGVNALPLTLVLFWFEQKAIVILLTLRALGLATSGSGRPRPGS